MQKENKTLKIGSLKKIMNLINYQLKLIGGGEQEYQE